MLPGDRPSGIQADQAPSSYRTQSRDTSYWADQLMFTHLRSLDPQATAALIGSACRLMDEIVLIGLQREHPRADPDELRLRAGVLAYGAELMERLTGLTLPRP